MTEALSSHVYARHQKVHYINNNVCTKQAERERLLHSIHHIGILNIDRRHLTIIYEKDHDFSFHLPTFHLQWIYYYSLDINFHGFRG